MKNETLKQIINQIKKYDLVELFKDVDQFKNWVLNLNKTQIDNFLSLNINLEKVNNFKHLLINVDLLNCKDYKQRVDAISTLKNGDGCWHLYNNICDPIFLKSKNFYKDIEMISKADTTRFGLWVLGNEDFINSPYHDEDLKLIVETHDIKEEKTLDYVVSDALASVAVDINSIKSPYHRADMKLISTSGSDCLQMSSSYPKSGLNNLAIDEVSLADKYHLENMKLLADAPDSSYYLYQIMTDSKFVKGKNYRQEVDALLNAKSINTARALYYYIVNPKNKYLSDINFLNDSNYEIGDVHISDKNSVSGSDDPEYLNNLIKINQIDDKVVMYFVSLLMNPNFINSKYKKFDIELLQSVSDKSIFMDLYLLMKDENSLNSVHHKKDAVIISKTIAKDVRKLLLKSATQGLLFNNDNHDYDMQYISNLDLDSIEVKIYNEIYYYLFHTKGISDPQRKEKLEKLLQGIIVERSSSVSSFFDDIQAEIENSNGESQTIESILNINSKPKTKILNLFKKTKKDE